MVLNNVKIKERTQWFRWSTAVEAWESSNRTRFLIMISKRNPWSGDERPIGYEWTGRHFIVLTGKTLESFLEINKNTPKGAPVGILICGDTKKSHGDFYIQDCSAATQNILLAAHAKCLGFRLDDDFPWFFEHLWQPCWIYPDYVVPFAFTQSVKPATTQSPTKPIWRKTRFIIMGGNSTDLPGIHAACSGKRLLKRKNSAATPNAQGVSISCIQYFGGSLNSNTLFHSLVLDGVFQKRFMRPIPYWNPPR